MQKAKTVEAFLEKNMTWQSELMMLREILRQTPLEETVKWGMPCYTHGGKNIVGLVGFSNYFGLWFYNGIAHPDPESVFTIADGKPENTMRQWRFTSKDEVAPDLVLSYIETAITLGAPKQKPREIELPDSPEELTDLLEGDADLKAAFDALTPGRRKEYIKHIADAKRAETRQKRLKGIIPKVLAGKGLSDHYRC